MSTMATDNTPFTQQPSSRDLLLLPRIGVYITAVACCCAASAAGLLQGNLLLLIVLSAVSLAMWHGAYDTVQGRRLLEPQSGSHWMRAFFAVYTALVLVTLLLWWVLPFVSLVLFLTYSAWHFGTESDHETARPAAALAAFALGAVPIVVACRWHDSVVIPIFVNMLGSKAAADSTSLAHALSALCWPVLAVALGGALFGQFGRNITERAASTLVIALTAALFAFFNPLLAFAVYFCCWHTPEHLVSTSQPTAAFPSLQANIARNLRAGFVPWLGSLILLAAVLFFGWHAAASYSSEMFIVLSALTVPHMALNELGRMHATRSAADSPCRTKGVRFGLHRA